MKTEAEINAEVNRLSKLADDGETDALDLIQVLNWVLGDEDHLPL